MTRLASLSLVVTLILPVTAQAQTLYNPGCGGINDPGARLLCDQNRSADPGAYRYQRRMQRQYDADHPPTPEAREYLRQQRLIDEQRLAERRRRTADEAKQGVVIDHSNDRCASDPVNCGRGRKEW